MAEKPADDDPSRFSTSRKEGGLPILYLLIGIVGGVGMFVLIFIWFFKDVDAPPPPPPPPMNAQENKHADSRNGKHSDDCLIAFSRLRGEPDAPWPASH